MEASIPGGAQAPPSTPASIPVPIAKKQQQQQQQYSNRNNLPPRPAVHFPPALPQIAPEQQALLNQYNMGFVNRFQKYNNVMQQAPVAGNRRLPVGGVNHVRVQSPPPFRDPDTCYDNIMRENGITPTSPNYKVPPPPPPNAVLERSGFSRRRGGENMGISSGRRRVNFRDASGSSHQEGGNGKGNNNKSSKANDGKPRFMIEDSSGPHNSKHDDNYNLDGAAEQPTELEPASVPFPETETPTCAHECTCTEGHSQLVAAQTEAQGAYIAALAAQEIRQQERKRTIGKVVLDTMAEHKMRVDKFTGTVEALQHAIDITDGKMVRMQQDIARLNLQVARYERNSASSTSTTINIPEEEVKSTWGEKFQWFLKTIFCLPTEEEAKDPSGNRGDNDERRPLLEGNADA